MGTRTITTVVAEDGTIHLPEGTARPGDIVVVHIEGATAAPTPVPPDRDLDWLILETATTPELKEAFIQKWLAIGRSNRAQLPEEEINDLNGDWLYDENGLPK